MAEIIPVINCAEQEEAVRILRMVEALRPAGAAWVHLDVADGKFTFHKTWNNPAAIRNLRSEMKWEVHLMVEEPEKIADEWLEAGAARLVVHYESIFDPRLRFHKIDPALILGEIQEKCRIHDAELMLALSPETPVERVLATASGVKHFQILAVHPGLPGQSFLPLSLEKISFLRRQVPDAIIEVDGGVNPDTVARAKAAGANLFATGTYLWTSGDPTRAFLELSAL